MGNIDEIISKGYITRPCSTTKGIEFVPKKRERLNLKKIVPNIEKKFDVEIDTPYVIVFNVKGYAVSLFMTGKISVKKIEKEEKGRKIIKEVLKILADS